MFCGKAHTGPWKRQDSDISVSRERLFRTSQKRGQQGEEAGLLGSPEDGLHDPPTSSSLVGGPVLLMLNIHMHIQVCPPALASPAPLTAGGLAVATTIPV